MSSPGQAADDLARSLLGPEIEISVTEFESGALDLALRWPGHFAVIQGKGDEWGLSVDIPAGEEFMGHKHIFSSLEESLQAAKNSMNSAEQPEDADNRQRWIYNRLTESSN